MLSFGYQSRPDAHRAPAGALRPGHTDCSVWVRCYDEGCQASLADAVRKSAFFEPFECSIYDQFTKTGSGQT